MSSATYLVFCFSAGLLGGLVFVVGNPVLAVVVGLLAVAFALGASEYALPHHWTGYGE